MWAGPQASFVANHLGPTIRRDHPGVKIMIHDDQARPHPPPPLPPFVHLSFTLTKDCSSVSNPCAGLNDPCWSTASRNLAGSNSSSASLAPHLTSLLPLPLARRRRGEEKRLPELGEPALAVEEGEEAAGTRRFHQP